MGKATWAWRLQIALCVAFTLLAAACGGSATTEETQSVEQPTESAEQAVDEPEPTATAVPEPTATPVPEPTATPLPTPTPGPDTDGDGTPDSNDEDDDGDGVPDAQDDFPLDSTRMQLLASQFPVVDGVAQLPDVPSVQGLRWVQDKLATSDPTTEEVQATFSPAFLSQFSAQQIIDFIAQLRDQFSGRLEPIDARVVSEWWLWVNMVNPDNPAAGLTIIEIEIDPNTGLIDTFRTNPANPGLPAWIYATDTGLSIADAVASLGTKGPDSSVVVAEITDDGCSVVAGHNETVPGAIGSLFKTWVVGALATEIEAGTISPNDTVTFVPGNYITGGSKSTGRFTSEFELTVQQASNLMINISDNGATDVMMDFVGRDATTEWVFASGHSDPEGFSPMLNASEFFHLWGNVSRSEALAYLDSDEATQREFADSRLAGLGAFNGAVQRNFGAHVESWHASPLDACNNFAAMRAQFPLGTQAGDFVEEVMGGEALLFGLRNEWDRVWYKGGGIPGDTPNSSIARSDGMMLESNDGRTYMLVGIYNELDDRTGGIPNDPFAFELQSLYAQIAQHLVLGTGQ